MSDKKQITKKTVTIKESHLIDLIDNIVNEAVSVEKQKWINENVSKTSLLEQKLAKLEAVVNRLTEAKK
jgi:hypothetical protein